MTTSERISMRLQAEALGYELRGLTWVSKPTDGVSLAPIGVNKGLSCVVFANAADCRAWLNERTAAHGVPRLEAKRG